MASYMNKRKIRNLLVNFRAQNRVIAVNLLFMMLVLVLTVSIIYTHLNESETDAASILNFPLGNLNISLSLKLIFLYTFLLFTFILSIICQLWITHRVCGPLVNFCNTYKRIAGGDFLKRIHLRKGDLLQEEAEQFNEMVTRISELVNELKTERDRLNAAARDAAEKK